MPLTAKGEKIKGAMEEEYGKEKGEEVFYASANKGTITGVHDAQETTTRLGQICDSIGHLCSRFDAFLRGKGRVDAKTARVVKKDGKWWFEINGELYGPHLSKEAAQGAAERSGYAVADARDDAVPLAQAEAEFAAADRERDEMKEKVRAALRSGMSLADVEAKYGARQKEIERRFKAASNAVVASRDKYGWPGERR